MDLSSFGTPAGLRDDFCLEGNEEMYCNYSGPAIIAPKLAIIPLNVFLYGELDTPKKDP
jgi:hypothetical protein